MYGWRCRIGLIIPSSNTTLEPEFSSFSPEGISVHAARLPLKKVTEKELISMSTHVERCSKLLSDAKVDVIAYGCTSGSLIKGKGYDEELEEKISAVTGIPAVSTARAVIDMLNSKELKRIAVATPYIDEINQKEEKFLVESGFTITKMFGLGLVDNLDIGRQDPSTAYRLGKEVMKDSPEAEGLFISCTNFRTFGIITTLACDIEKPVITSNQATLECALKKAELSEAIDELERSTLL